VLKGGSFGRFCLPLGAEVKACLCILRRFPSQFTDGIHNASVRPGPAPRGGKRMKCKCGKKAIVALNGQWFCLNCFDKAMAGVGKTIRKINQEVLHE